MEKQEASSVVSKWVGEIECYEQQFQKWETKSKKIIDRYIDERDANSKATKFNILWSNIQTLHPAIYANPPTPNIDRRYEGEDDLGRYASMVLERSVSYYVKNDLFDKVMKQSTLDRLLCGRGVVWVRYCPVIEDKVQITDDAENKDYEEEAPELISEDVTPDYVHWGDFGHTWARTWQEVRGVWRRVFMSRTELVKRFGEEVGNAVPLDAEQKGARGEKLGTNKSATIYEIWDKSTKKAIWIHKAYPKTLDELDDPLGLKDFFPCPEPIYATLSNDNLIPIPDYIQYQDQAIELDMITARIAAITNAVRVIGVYDASAEGVDRLLSEGSDNKLVPVENFAMMGQGNGIQGVVSLFPLAEVINTLTSLYAAREQVKKDLFEITGISDIVRGQGAASETATAQQIKGQFATMRLDNNQKDVARFSKDLVVIMTEIIAKHFSLDTIKQVSGIRLLTAMEKQQIEAQQQQAMMMAQQTGQEPPALPEEVQELLKLPTWEDLEALFRNDTARDFRIDIETDSTIKGDQDSERQARIEFLGAVSNFMQQAVNVPPDLQPLAMDLLLFGVRGFKVSRELETAFESALDNIKKAKENPEPPTPDPAIEAEKQRTQSQIQIENMKHQSQMQQLQAKSQHDNSKMMMEKQKSEIDLMLKQADIEIKKIELAIKQVESENKKARLIEGSSNVLQV